MYTANQHVVLLCAKKSIPGGMGVWVDVKAG